jgi:hypothetical protein
MEEDLRQQEVKSEGGVLYSKTDSKRVRGSSFEEDYEVEKRL